MYSRGHISGPMNRFPPNLGCECFSSCFTDTWYSKWWNAKKVFLWRHHFGTLWGLPTLARFYRKARFANLYCSDLEWKYCRWFWADKKYCQKQSVVLEVFSVSNSIGSCYKVLKYCFLYISLKQIFVTKMYSFVFVFCDLLEHSLNYQCFFMIGIFLQVNAKH